MQSRSDGAAAEAVRRKLEDLRARLEPHRAGRCTCREVVELWGRARACHVVGTPEHRAAVALRLLLRFGEGVADLGASQLRDASSEMAGGAIAGPGAAPQAPGGAEPPAPPEAAGSGVDLLAETGATLELAGAVAGLRMEFGAAAVLDDEDVDAIARDEAFTPALRALALSVLDARAAARRSN